ncbi:MAG: hypothetical protein ACO1HA_07210 [Bacteroidota bacterium]
MSLFATSLRIRLAGLFALILPLLSAAQPAGTLDPSFGNAGRFVQDFGFQDNLTHIAVQPQDQKVVTVGTALTPAFAGQLLVIRLLPNGTPDSTFNGTGVIIVPDFTESYAYRVVVRDDGKILVGGASCDPSYNFSFLVMRFNEDGSRDTTFGQSGISSVDLSSSDDIAYGMAELNDGRILLAGQMTDPAFNKAPVIIRLEEDGSLDSTFGTNGVVAMPVTGQDSRFWNIAVQADGRITACGHYDQGLTGSGQFNFDVLVARYWEDGSPDNGFGTNGIVMTPYSAEYVEDGFGLALTPDGGCYVAGYTTQPDFSFDLLLAKYDSTGTLDTGFDTDGIAIWDSAAQDVAYDMVLQPDGKPLLAGTSGGFFMDDRDFLLVRYNADGSLDTDFDGDGYSVTTVAASFDEANGICLQADGKILAAGKGNTGSNNDVAVMRFNNDLFVGITEPTATANLSCWPVPVRTGSVLHVSSSLRAERIELTDLFGRTTLLHAGAPTLAQSTIEIILPATIAAGTYHVRMTDQNGKLAQTRLLVVE